MFIYVYLLCYSVEQFLSDREMDPEKMLKNLGFGFSPDTDLSCGRIPDRFLLSPSSADGIDLYKFVLNHPDLHHLLWMWDKKTDTQSTSGAMSNQSTGRKSGQCTSLNNQVTSSNKTETQSVSRAGNQKVGQGHCARQDNMVVDNENGWGIYNSDNKENVCDITDSNIARLKQYVETLYARSNASDASLDQLESVPDRYFHNVDKNSAGHRKKKITLDLFDVGNSDLKDKIDIDGTKDNSLVNDSIKPGETDFPKLANASGSENRKGIDNIFRGKRVLLGDDKMESSYKEVNDREHQKTDGSDVDKKTLLPEIDEEDNKPANDSESAGDFKSFGSWSSDSNESLQDVYNVELDENESLV